MGRGRFLKPLKKVLEELLSDRLLEGHQHSGFDLRQNMIRRVIRFSAVMPMVLCHSNWPSCALDLTRYQFQLCCTLTRPSRGGEFLSIQSTVSYHIRYRIRYHIRYHTRYLFLKCLSCFFSAFWHLPLVAVGSQNNDIHVMSKSYAWAPGGAQAAPWAPGGILSSRGDPIRIGLFMISGFWYDDFLSAVTTSTCK